MLEAGNNAFAPRLPVHDLALVIAHPAGGGKKRTKEEAAMGGPADFSGSRGEAEGQAARASSSSSSTTCRDPQLLSTPWLPPHPLTSLTAQARMK